VFDKVFVVYKFYILV